MKIAVLNAGSSSLKYKLYNMPSGELLDAKNIAHIGEKSSAIQTHQEAFVSLNIDFASLDGVGHRVVHGGEQFSSATLLEDDVIKELENLNSLAPLHNPVNLLGIKIAKELAPTLKQVAVFDTAFHSSMPQEAFLYALPYNLYKEHKIRRYGFHGSSHSFVLKEAAKVLGRDVNTLNIISLHLGNGASACAIENGKSIDTSMGFTPLEGLVMGSRSGDIDPAIVLHLQTELNMSVEQVSEILNRESGLLGIAKENDLEALLQRDDTMAELAISMMVRQIQKYIGAYMVLLDEVDAIVFTGGIGENSLQIRERVMQTKILAPIKTLVIQTDEELEIANEVYAILGASNG